jgi:aryl-alcohol dehydrogenase-like predicted oxidoreductase
MSELTRREFLQAGAASGAVLLAQGVPLQAQEAKDKLPQRVLGKTGVRVPILGLGTVAVGNTPNEKDALALINRAIDLGVTYIDTAPARTSIAAGTGYARAHSYLKAVLKDRRKEVFIATKCLETDGEKALATLQKNLEELGVEQADLLYSHSIGHALYDVAKLTGTGGTMEALEKAKRDGLTRFVGITGHNRPEKFVQVLEKRDIDAMMNAVNVVDRHTYAFEDVVWPLARKKNVGLVAMKVFGGAGGANLVTGCKMPEELRHASFRYALSVPGVTLNVIGMGSREQLEQNVAWAKGFKPISAEEAQEWKAKTVELAKTWGAHLDRLDPRGEKSRPLVNT